MMEYLYPGVYVEEIEAVTRAIDDGSVAIDDARLRSLMAELQQTVASYLPEWTSPNEHDPGVALLQLLAWLAAALANRTEKLPASGRMWAFRGAERLFELAGSSAASSETPKRPSYFSGQMLDATTLQSEQNYSREKRRRHNRLLHGFGIVSGLGVNVAPADDQGGSRVIVEPGYAIDARGEELALPGGATLALPEGDEATFVTLRFWEHPCPDPSTSESDSHSVPWVEEVCVIGVGPLVPPSAFAVARLVRLDDNWTVDAKFVAPRIAQA